MKQIVKYLLLIIFLLVPFQANALSKNYEDLVYKIVNVKQEEGKVNLYFFHSEVCPHCKKETELLKDLDKKYKDLNIYMFETSKVKENSKLMATVKIMFNVVNSGVPFTVIGDRNFVGYSDIVGEQIENTIQEYLEIEEKTENEKNTFTLPLIGKTNVKDVSLPVIAIILGFVDGFNPCAMWILLFLINMLFKIKNKKRMFILGYTFLFTSALVYFLSMLGISLVLSLTTIGWIQKLIALVALVVGILNIRTYIKTRKDDGCHVVDDKKRKRIFKQIQKFTSERSLLLALIGVIVLAASVNLVELACSFGFPAVFSDILTINSVDGATRIIYLLLYVLFYMIDDLIVFTIAVSTLAISTKSTKYTKYVNLVAGIIMILMGMLLIFKPDWIMFNF